MNFEPENYSRRALLWFAAVIDIAGWVAVFVVTWGSAWLLNGWQHERTEILRSQCSAEKIQHR